MGIELAIAGAVASVIGTAVSTSLGIAGAVQANKQAEANAEAQAAQAAYNAKVEANEAARVEAEAAEQARRQHEEAEAAKARQRALLGKSGAALTSGSPLAILGESAATMQQEINETHRAGYIRAAAHKEQQKNFLFQEKVAEASKPSSAALALNIGGQLASGTAQIGSTLLNFGSNYDRLKKKDQ